VSEKKITKDYLRSLDEMMILVELFLHYRGLVPVTFLDWEDYSGFPGEIAKVIRLDKHDPSKKEWKKLKDWLIKADYATLKDQIRSLCLVIAPEQDTGKDA